MDYLVVNEQIKLVIEQNDGIASASEFQKAGIERIQLYYSLLQGILVKESHGNYMLAEECPDQYRIIQSRSNKLVYSHSTALYLNGLLEDEPIIIDITVPQGDNVSRLKRYYENVGFHYCKKEISELGLTTLKTSKGYDVTVYDTERSICDIIKDKKNMDTQVYSVALKNYFGTVKDYGRLIEYARRLNLEKRVRAYLDVLG